MRLGSGRFVVHSDHKIAFSGRFFRLMNNSGWVPILPGMMIFLTSMAFNLLSDGLRDAMDVRL